MSSDLTDTIAGKIDLLSLAAANPRRYPFLLTSSAQNGITGRRDILFAFPGATLALQPSGRTTFESEQGITQETTTPNFLEALEQERKKAQALLPYVPTTRPGIPFVGGWFVYLGYELAAQIESTLHLPAGDDGLPVAFATRIPAAIIVDHEQNSTQIVVEPGRNDLAELLRDDVLRASSFIETALPKLSSWVEDDPANFLRGVDRIKDYIVAGDVFQVNFSRAWRGEWSQTPDVCSLFRRLSNSNPAPFAGMAITPWGSIVSSSPERLVQVIGDEIQTRPIAGTHRRSGNPQEDQSLSSKLLAHPKERAEHVMLIDLERNDMGRICVPGTIRVDEFMTLESYAHVHHIVSNVRGQLRKDVMPAQVLSAVFPGGTITGCPKVRCMEIIAELEQTGRSAYTGAFGYLNLCGDMDFNILIRTFVINGSAISLRAGAGIVADSDAQTELAETRVKAEGLLRAIEADVGRA